MCRIALREAMSGNDDTHVRLKVGAIICVMTVPALLLLMVLAARDRECLRLSGQRDVLQMSNSIRKELSTFIEKGCQILDALSALEAIRDYDESFPRLLSRMIEKAPIFGDIRLVDSTGQTIACASHAHFDEGIRKLFRGLFSARDTVSPRVLLPAGTGVPLFFKPFSMGAGRPPAALVAVPNRNNFTEVLRSTRLPAETVVFMFDGDGRRLLIHGDERTWGGASIAFPMSDGGPLWTVRQGGKEYIFNVAPLLRGNPDGLCVVVGIPVTLMPVVYPLYVLETAILAAVLALAAACALLAAERALIRPFKASLRGRFLSERALRMYSECTQIIMEAEDEIRLLHAICERIAEEEEYPGVWIGIPQNDDLKTVIPVVSVGREGGMRFDERMSWADDVWGRGTPGTVIRSRVTYVCNDIAANPHFKPWKDGLLSKGAASSIGVPLSVGGELFGVFVAYGPKTDAFTADKVRLLEGLVARIGFGVEALRSRVQREELLKSIEASERTLRELTAATQESLEREKADLARELHDELGQDLTLMRMDLSSALREARDEKSATAPTIERIRTMVDETIGKVRAIATELRPVILDQFGLSAAIEWLVDKVREKSGITITVDFLAESADLDRGISTGLFRIFQEALTNAVRHAKAAHIGVSLQREDSLVRLSVRDDGEGIAPREAAGGASLGIRGMQERALQMGGLLEVRPGGEGGTVVSAVIPVGARVDKP